MKEKTCRICKRRVEPWNIILDNIILCKTCFDFMLAKYGNINKIQRVLKIYKKERRKNETN